MKNYLKIIFSIILFFLLVPFFTEAITFNPPFETKSFEELINAIADFIFWVAIAIVPIMIIVAAYFFLTSGGDPAKIGQAKKVLLYTLIGLFIVLSARGIVSIIGSLFEGGGGPGPGPSCTPTVPPCNGVCPAGCTVAQDPDCGCQNGNGCCGIGCNSTNDNDCPPPGGGLTPAMLQALGDVDQDCLISGSDAGAIGLAWHSKPGDPNWNPDADLDKNDYVDEYDAAIIQKITWWWQCGESLTCERLLKLGDIDGSHQISVGDAGAIGLAWHSKPGDPNWNPDADLNKDDIVDNYDLLIIQKITWMWKCS